MCPNQHVFHFDLRLLTSVCHRCWRASLFLSFSLSLLSNSTYILFLIVGTDLGRLLKRYRGKVNEVCTSKLPPPTIIKTFATYFSDKVADELNLKDLVGNMNDEIQSNGGERKEETARCLDILTEDLIMGTLEVTDLCNQYFKEELRRCDKHWQDQQSWLRKIGARELSVRI